MGFGLGDWKLPWRRPWTMKWILISYRDMQGLGLRLILLVANREGKGGKNTVGTISCTAGSHIGSAKLL